MGNKLEGKIAVITGGASGIGLATAKRFVLEGAYVFIFDRNKKELELALSEIGKNVVGVEGDVSNIADLDRLYEIVKDQKKRSCRHCICKCRYNTICSIGENFRGRL